MKASSIRTHLAEYVMVARRKTTINHMFASAIAPVDLYVETELRAAMISLGQNPDADLSCVYCDEPAQTWDHLKALVQGQQFSGFGHQLGNLVPSCKRCNSRKGNKPYDEYILTTSMTPEDARCRIARISAYSERYLPRPLAQHEYARRWPEDMSKLDNIRQQILELMQRADAVAARLRLQAGAESDR